MAQQMAFDRVTYSTSTRTKVGSVPIEEEVTVTGWNGLAITATVVVASLGAVACGGGSDGATATPMSNERPR